MRRYRCRRIVHGHGPKRSAEAPARRRHDFHGDDAGSCRGPDPRSEIRQQVANLGLATKDDIDRLERKITDVASRGPAKKAASAGKGRPAKKASGPAKKARPAKQASTPAKRSAAKRSAR
jgi:hypothetical protein